MGTRWRGLALEWGGVLGLLVRGAGGNQPEKRCHRDDETRAGPSNSSKRTRLEESHLARKRGREEIARKADDMVSQLALARQAVAVQVAVSVDGRTVYSRAFGYGDVENGVRYGTGSRAKVASVSKLFATHALMSALHRHWREGMTSQSREEEKGWEWMWMFRRLTTHGILKDFPYEFYYYEDKMNQTGRGRRQRSEEFGWSQWIVDKEDEEMQIPALAFLSHTVGISHYLSADSMEGDYLRFESATAAYRHLLKSGKLQVLHNIFPGESTERRVWSEYTSFGTVVAGAMVERLQELTYHRYLANVTCAEMNLRDTFAVDCPESDSSLVDYVTGYCLEEDEEIGGLGKKLINEYHRDYSMMHTSEGLASTALDLVKFGDIYARMYRNRHLKPPDSPLPASTVQDDMFAMFAGRLLMVNYEQLHKVKTPDIRMGVGWTLEESPTRRHYPREERKEEHPEVGVSEWRLDAFHTGQAVAGTSVLRVRLAGEPARKLGRFHPLARWGIERDAARRWLTHNRLYPSEVPPEIRQHMQPEKAAEWAWENKNYSIHSRQIEEDFEDGVWWERARRKRQIDSGLIEPWQLTRDVAHQQHLTTTSSPDGSRKTVVVAIIAQLRYNTLEDLSRDLATLFESYDEGLD